MNKESLLTTLEALFASCPGNVLTEETAMAPELVGLRMYDGPLVGFAAAEDPLFNELQKATAVGPWHRLPSDWLPESQTVISIFLPFSESVRVANRGNQVSPQWLQARIEGQQFLNTLTAAIRDHLKEQGFAACAPSLEKDFFSYAGKGRADHPEIPNGRFGSNWSERHVAYICGLGTFGLSKGLITKKGVAGRFSSIITTLPVEIEPRPYTGLYDYCTMCGTCIARCPVDAISLEKGKEHAPCSALLDQSQIIHAPRYGCGLCQTAVPCESGIPQK